MDRDASPLAQLRSLDLNDRESHRLSACTLRKFCQTLDSVGRFGADRGLALSARSSTATLLRDYHA